jgi:hypothetical protein
MEYCLSAGRRKDLLGQVALHFSVRLEFRLARGEVQQLIAIGFE